MNRIFGRLTTTVRQTFAKGRNALTAVRPARVSWSMYTSTVSRQYLDNENFNMHNTMVNDPTYELTVVNLDVRKDWPVVTEKQFHELVIQDFHTRTATEVCDDFLRISVYATGKKFSLMDTMFDGLRNQLIAVLPKAADHQLMSIFRLIPLWGVKNAKDPIYFKLWSEFDKECIVRYKKWSINKLLLFMDHWYIMKLSRLSNFVWMGVRKMARKPSRLVYSLGS